MRATLWTEIGASLLVAATLGLVALLPLRAHPGDAPSPAWVLLPLAAVAGAIFYWLNKSSLREEARSDDVSRRGQGWFLDLMYYDPRDPSMLVPKQIGWGFAPNLGHPVMKIAFSLSLVQLLGAIYYATG